MALDKLHVKINGVDRTNSAKVEERGGSSVVVTDGGSSYEAKCQIKNGVKVCTGKNIEVRFAATADAAQSAGGSDRYSVPSGGASGSDRYYIPTGGSAGKSDRYYVPGGTADASGKFYLPGADTPGTAGLSPADKARAEVDQLSKSPKKLAATSTERLHNLYVALWKENPRPPQSDALKGWMLGRVTAVQSSLNASEERLTAFSEKRGTTEARLAKAKSNFDLQYQAALKTRSAVANVLKGDVVDEKIFVNIRDRVQAISIQAPEMSAKEQAREDARAKKIEAAEAKAKAKAGAEAKPKIPEAGAPPPVNPVPPAVPPPAAKPAAAAPKQTDAQKAIAEVNKLLKLSPNELRKVPTTTLVQHYISLEQETPKPKQLEALKQILQGRVGSAVTRLSDMSTAIKKLSSAPGTTDAQFAKAKSDFHIAVEEAVSERNTVDIVVKQELSEQRMRAGEAAIANLKLAPPPSPGQRLAATKQSTADAKFLKDAGAALSDATTSIELVAELDKNEKGLNDVTLSTLQGFKTEFNDYWKYYQVLSKTAGSTQNQGIRQLWAEYVKAKPQYDVAKTTLGELIARKSGKKEAPISNDAVSKDKGAVAGKKDAAPLALTPEQKLAAKLNKMMDATQVAFDRINDLEMLPKKERSQIDMSELVKLDKVLADYWSARTTVIREHAGSYDPAMKSVQSRAQLLTRIYPDKHSALKNMASERASNLVIGIQAQVRIVKGFAEAAKSAEFNAAKMEFARKSAAVKSTIVSAKSLIKDPEPYLKDIAKYGEEVKAIKPAKAEKVVKVSEDEKKQLAQVVKLKNDIISMTPKLPRSAADSARMKTLHELMKAYTDIDATFGSLNKHSTGEARKTLTMSVAPLFSILKKRMNDAQESVFARIDAYNLKGGFSAKVESFTADKLDEMKWLKTNGGRHRLERQAKDVIETIELVFGTTKKRLAKDLDWDAQGLVLKQNNNHVNDAKTYWEHAHKVLHLIENANRGVWPEVYETVASIAAKQKQSQDKLKKEVLGKVETHFEKMRLVNQRAVAVESQYKVLQARRPPLYQEEWQTFLDLVINVNLQLESPDLQIPHDLEAGMNQGTWREYNDLDSQRSTKYASIFVIKNSVIDKIAKAVKSPNAAVKDLENDLKIMNSSTNLAELKGVYGRLLMLDIALREHQTDSKMRALSHQVTGAIEVLKVKLERFGAQAVTDKDAQSGSTSGEKVDRVYDLTIDIKIPNGPHAIKGKETQLILDRYKILQEILAAIPKSNIKQLNSDRAVVDRILKDAYRYGWIRKGPDSLISIAQATLQGIDRQLLTIGQTDLL